MNEARERKKNNLFAILFRYRFIPLVFCSFFFRITFSNSNNKNKNSSSTNRERERGKKQLNPSVVERYRMRHQSNVQYHPHSFQVIGGSA